MCRRIDQRADSDAGDIFVGRRRVLFDVAVAERHREHAEMSRHVHTHQIVVGKPPDIDGGYGHLRPHPDQDIAQ